jgi:DNA-binding NtrC family response regulator
MGSSCLLRRGAVKVLLADDEKSIRLTLGDDLEASGHDVKAAADGKEALDLIEKERFDVLITDIKMPGVTGIELLSKAKESSPDTEVILITGFGTIESAVEAMKLGAYDYITKPFDMEHVLRTADKALETTKLRREVRELRRHIQHEYSVSRIIGRDACMLALFDVIERVAQSGASTVFLRGDSGTGKDLVARVIHYNSDRAPRPFMNITCTALSETLLESELFGHEKGAFTDAKSTKKGLFELADGGTIFLDEVGDMPMGLQAKLLRFLEERMFRRVGGTQEISVDVRVIAATNRNLEEAIRKGTFREDLYYRLNVVTFALPPLRERKEDIPPLIEHFLKKYSRENRKTVVSVSKEAKDLLMNYHYPGNIRELENILERAVVLCRGDTVTTQDLPLNLRESKVEDLMKDAAGGRSLPETLEEIERLRITQALEKSHGVQTQAAEELGISERVLRYKMKKYGVGEKD